MSDNGIEPWTHVDGAQCYQARVHDITLQLVKFDAGRPFPENRWIAACPELGFATMFEARELCTAQREAFMRIGVEAQRVEAQKVKPAT